MWASSSTKPKFLLQFMSEEERSFSLGCFVVDELNWRVSNTNRNQKGDTHEYCGPGIREIRETGEDCGEPPKRMSI